MNNIVNEIQTKLKQKGYRASLNRGFILQVLDKAERPLTIGEIYERASSLHVKYYKSHKLNESKFDQSTAYRIIENLGKEGFVKIISLLEGYNRYELERGDHHHHFVCVECQVITPVHLKNHLSESEEMIEQETGATITNHSLEFFGVCRSCKLNP